MDNSVKNLVKYYEKLSKNEKDVFKKELSEKENEYYSEIYASRKERMNSVIADRNQKLDEMEKEIVVMLKQALPKVNSLLKYATFEGKILHIQKNRIGFDVVMDRSKKFEFYCETFSGVGLGYNRGKGFLFAYANGQPCTSVSEQYECACNVSMRIEKDYDQIIQIIDRKVDTIINYNQKADRDTKSCYKF